MGRMGEVLGYDAGGSLLPGRNYSSSSYNYGFNGKPKDDEIYGSTGTSYDFGARLYDPRVGRWLSLDPLAIRFPYESNYLFAGGNPIYYVDEGGKYKYPTNKAAEFTKIYPVITKYLSSMVEKDVMNSALIMNALSYATNETKKPGTEGALNGTELRGTVAWKSGPTIDFVEAPGGARRADGHYDSKSKTIQVNKDLAQFVQNVSDEDRPAALFAVMNTIYHETAHYGEDIESTPGAFDSEAGGTYEEKAHGSFEWYNRWGGQLIHRKDDDTIDYDATLKEAKIAMDEMRKSEKGVKALPSNDSGSNSDDKR